MVRRTVPKNILAVRTDRFGEFLLNIPAFRALKLKFPEAKLTLVVNPYVQELARCIDVVDEVIPWENKKHRLQDVYRFSEKLKKKNFGLCVIFNPSKEFNIISFLAGIPLRAGYARKWGFLLTHKIPDEKHLGDRHEIEYNLDLVKLIGAAADDKKLSLVINEDLAEQLLKGIDLNNSIVIHPWTSDLLKQWPTHKFFLLAQRLTKELRLTVIFIGGKEESDNSGELFAGFKDSVINLTGKTSLTQLAAVLKQSKLLISGDSGPVHLACCVGTPVVAIFRNDMPGKSPVRWGPRSEGSIVVEKNNLFNISVEEVFDKVKEILSR